MGYHHRNPADPDPDLCDALAKGHSEQFEANRQRAIDILETNDLAAFWLQALGDGTTIEAGPDDPLGTPLPHQPLHCAGYDDDLTYPELRAIATKGCAHHLGLALDPYDPHKSPTEIATDAIGPIATQAKRIGPHVPDEATQVPHPGPLSERLDQAITILNGEDLSGFWLQAFVEGSVAHFQFDPTASDDADGVRSRTTAYHSIEYTYGLPETLDYLGHASLMSELHMQHLFVGAHTANQSIEQFTETCIEQVCESGYIHEAL